MGANPAPFGKYELIARLAAGGMAEIFLARTKSIQGFEKYLVIKKILKTRTSDPEFVRMFLDEARVAATLDHPNIVQIYDVGSVDGEYFIAMEYLRGHNLIEMVRAGTKLGYAKPPLEHVMSTLTGVCAGLHYAHEKHDFSGRPLEIVHRDVTPQNVVVTFDGAVKVVDFGIAKVATREVETLAGTLKGKIGYMSPEQCRGSAIDRRSDIFAVGILLYELTTGKRLYHERSDFETLKKIIEGPVPEPRDILPFYPETLNAIVVRCLQKRPEDRYQTARELHADLDAFAREHQLVTGTVPLAQYMERLFADELAAQRNADTGGLVFAQGASLVSASSSPSYLGESSRRSGPTEVPLLRARRQHLAKRALQALVTLLLVASGGLFVWWRTHPLEGTLGTSSAVMPRQPVAALPTPVVTALPGPPPVPRPHDPPPNMAPARPKPAAKPGDAHITVASDPRCEVLVDGVPFGATPLIDLPVPAGRHTLILLNSAAGIKEVQKLTLETGQLWTRSFQFEGGRVTVQTGLSPKMLAVAGPAPSPAEPQAPATAPRPVEGAASAPPPKPPAAPAPQPATEPAAPPIAPRPAAAPSGPPRTVAGFVLDAQRISSTEVHLPKHVIDARPHQTLRGTYKICVDPDGHVSDVSTIASIPGADATIHEAIRTWRYRPQSGPVCAAKALTFKVP